MALFKFVGVIRRWWHRRPHLRLSFSAVDRPPGT